MGCCMAPYKKRTGSGVKSTSDREQIKVSPSFFIKENELAFSELYMVGSKLGKGGYAEVKRCTHKPSTELRAVKIYSKQLYGPGKPEQGKMLEEMNIMAKLDHPNVIRIFDYFEDKKSYYLVMEYCEGGELFDKIKKGVKMTEGEAAKVMRQVISVLAYCHDLGIVHRDLKPENIMLDERKTELNIKIADFGTACYLDHNREAHGVIGTSLYMAPEVINFSSYNEKCDMWSCGVILYVLLTRRPPFEGADDDEIMENVKTGVYITESEEFNGISKEATEFIKKLLCASEERLSAKEALKDNWLCLFDPKPETHQALDKILANLLKFKSGLELRHAISTFIAFQISRTKEVSDAKAVFEVLDRDGDGKISKEDLAYYLERMQLQESIETVIERVFCEVDTDRDGYIQYTEYLRACLDKEVLYSKINLFMAFSIFDKDNDGKINVTELMRVLAKKGDRNFDTWKEIVSEADSNRDGEIDLEEFTNLLLNKI